VNVEAGTTTYRVALPEFEGPLDLLLHLCKTHEIAIVDIPIAFITTKYLEYLEVMQTMPVDIAADYLVMAATLAYLKSRELVPAPEALEVATDGSEEDSGLDPREELIRRLLEYQKYKDAAEQLGGRPIEGRNVFGRGGPIELDATTLGPAAVADESVWKLIEAFGRLLEKAGANPKSTHNVVVDRVSIGTRIHQLVDRLQGGGGSFRFDSCFDLTLPEVELRHQVVVTLLAILELARLKVVRVLQADQGPAREGEPAKDENDKDETLFITHIAGTDLEAARSVHVTSVSDEEGDKAESEDDEAESEDVEARSEVMSMSEGTATEADGTTDEASDEASDAGSEFDGDAADATLVEPAPAGAEDLHSAEVDLDRHAPPEEA
jgi:segregation and condensation protein A